MPIYEYLCLDCGQQSEILVTGSSGGPKCRSCGSESLKKLVSAHASPSGSASEALPGPGDTTCCGTDSMQAGCSGPGSCCGKA
jgi:putative FmdB family regulatory protein